MPRRDEEVNPDHPVTSKLHTEWHKVCLAIMVKLGVEEVVITTSDIGKMEALFPGDDPAILAHDKADGLHIRVISMTEAKRLGVQ